MEISFKSKAAFKSVSLSWLILSAASIVLLFFLHLVVYYIFYINKISLVQHFSGIWVTFYFYAIIWPGVIVNNYKAKLMIVRHDGEVDPERVKDFFLINRYSVIEDNPGRYRFESEIKFDKLFKGSRYVTIDYSDTEISIEMPANKVYHVHHGFKFGKMFLKDLSA
jgi:hypothetical protein